MNSFDEQVLQYVRALKATREKFLAAPNRKTAMAGLPKLEPEDYAAVVESWPNDYDRILNGESVATLAVMGMSMYLLAVTAKTLPIGTAYAVWTGIGAVMTFLK